MDSFMTVPFNNTVNIRVKSATTVSSKFGVRVSVDRVVYSYIQYLL